MKILFLQTGGTIDKAYTDSDDNHGYNFQISTPAFERIIKRVNPSLQFETKAILQKDSLDITEEDRNLIFEACRDSDANKIIITHGTDTMIDTGKLLQDITDKTIILTGAFVPEKFKDSDADFNLGTAVGAANSLSKGVFIAMGGRVIACDEAVFDSKLNQFTSKIEE